MLRGHKIIGLLLAIVAVAVTAGAWPSAGGEQAASAAKKRVRTNGVQFMAGEMKPIRTTKGRRPREPRGAYVERGGQERKFPPDRTGDQSTSSPPETSEGPPPSLRARRTRALVSAVPEFTIFRNKTFGSNDTSMLEPNVANARSGMLATGNTFAMVSPDHGLTWDFLDPNEGELYGGVCCDQLAYAVDRGGYSLVHWLLQDRYSKQEEQSDLRLRMFRGRDDLVDGSDACEFHFHSGDFRPARQWFDFNQISHTDKYLFITTNVRDADTGTDADNGDDDRIGAMIFRIALDDLDDGNCGVEVRYWYKDNFPYISPVQNADDRMHLAAHGTLSGSKGDILRVYSISDSSDTLTEADVDITDFADEVGTCFIPSGQNPCREQHKGRMSGFHSGSAIGWLFMADPSVSQPYPHTKVVVLEENTLGIVTEHKIWNSQFAWQIPSVGVNSKGHLGVLLFAMGNGRYPNPYGFIRTNPFDWSDIQTTGIATSDGWPAAEDTISWGHYGSVRPYGNCEGTFLGATYTTDSQVATGRSVWFGATADACVDLAMTSALRNGGGPLRSGETINVNTTIQNQGSAAAPASTIGYYLSRDAEISEDDIRFSDTRSASALAPEQTHVLEAKGLTVPGVAGLGGMFYVIACADDPEDVAEVGEKNNCDANNNPFRVSAGARRQEPVDFSTVIGVRTTTTKPRAVMTVSETITLHQGRVPGRQTPSTVYMLSPTAGRDDDEIRLTAVSSSTPRIVASQRRSRVVTRRLRLPRNVPPGRRYLIACLRHPPGRFDAKADNDCHISRRAIRVTGSQRTRGPKRRPVFRGD